MDNNILLDHAHHMLELIGLIIDISQWIVPVKYELPDAFITPALIVVLHHPQYGIQFIGGVNDIILIISSVKSH